MSETSKADAWWVCLAVAWAATLSGCDTPCGPGTGQCCDLEAIGQRCYDGPEGTTDVGACRSGILSCDPHTGHVSCLGQTLPAVEDHTSPDDEDCDGRADEGPAIACGDCGDAVDITLAELATRGPVHRVSVRLVPPDPPAPDGTVREAEVGARVGAIVEQVGAIPGAVVREVSALSVYAFTAEANITALTALLESREVAGITNDFRLDLHLAESTALVAAAGARRDSAVDGRGAVVAVVDSGIDYTHPAFGACARVGAPGCAVVAGVDLIDGDDDPMDAHGHGTQVASVIAGRPTPALPAGVAPGAHLVAVRVADGAGVTRYVDLLHALEWIADQRLLGVRVVNLGLGSDGPLAALQCDRMLRGEGPPTAIAQLIDTLAERGVLTVAASGNGGDAYAMSYPACLDALLSVGATYDADLAEPMTYTVGRGPAGARQCTDEAPRLDQVICASNGHPNRLDLVAPGAPIRTAALGGGAAIGAGTSLAAAHVSGAAALLFAEGRLRSPAAVEERLKDAAVLRRERRVEPVDVRPIRGYPVRRLDLGALLDRRCTDDDLDGYGALGPDCVAPLDCADDDPMRHPAAGEICDALDNDCDGQTDEGVANECGGCGPLAEVTCNGADDDCDGVTDEGPRVGVPCGGGRFYDAACNCVRNDFVGGWFNRYSCGGVQDGWDDEEHDMIAEGEYSHFECGVICTNAGVACCAARAGNCYEGSPDYWWVWPELTGWWSSRRGGGIPADVRE